GRPRLRHPEAPVTLGAMSGRSEEGGTHRPLPSVRIPLLRDELRASRMRRTAVLAAGVLLVVGGIASAIFLPGVFEGPSEPEGEAPVAAHLGELAGDAGVLELPDTPAAPEPDEASEPVAQPLPNGEGTRTVRPFGNA